MVFDVHDGLLFTLHAYKAFAWLVYTSKKQFTFLLNVLIMVTITDSFLFACSNGKSISWLDSQKMMQKDCESPLQLCNCHMHGVAATAA